MTSGSTKNNSETPSFYTATDTINDFEKFGRQRSRRLAAIWRFLASFGAYTRSFWLLAGEATEKTFSSVKKIKSIADLGNFFNNNRERFKLAAQFWSVRSWAVWARCFLKHFSHRSFLIIRTTKQLEDDYVRFIIVLRGTTVLPRHCGTIFLRYQYRRLYGTF